MTRCSRHLICPVCRARLAEADRTLRCPRGHAFDRARQGYVHLLPSGHGQSRLEGDVRAMVRARRAVLDRGHYEPVSDAINGMAERLLEGRDPTDGVTALDAGCGEGYYIGRLARALAGDAAGSGAEPCFFGVDLSKDAVRRAAGRYGGVDFLVNDIHHQICLADRSADLLLNVFAPRNPAEFARVVRADGGLIVVIPGADHLIELRDRLPLLGIEPDKREGIVTAFRERFEPTTEEPVTYALELAPAAAHDLLRMTPNYWHLDEATLAEVREWGPVRVTIQVRLLAFRRRG